MSYSVKVTYEVTVVVQDTQDSQDAIQYAIRNGSPTQENVVGVVATEVEEG